jgi:hypothetical protein
MISLFENLDSACEMTVFPQPKAPGMAVVPPCTHLRRRWDSISQQLVRRSVREKRIQYPLACKEWVICRLFLSHGTGRPDGPKLHHGMFGGLAFEFGLQNYILARHQEIQKWKECEYARSAVIMLTFTE